MLPTQGTAGLTPKLCRGGRAAWVLQRARAREGTVRWCWTLCTVPVPHWDICHYLENSFPGIAEATGSQAPLSAKRAGRGKNALKGLSTGEMVCSQEYSLQGKTKKCPLRFSFCFKKTQQILKAKENQIFLLCLETTSAYYKGLIQGPRLTSEDFESGARMA